MLKEVSAHGKISPTPPQESQIIEFINITGLCIEKIVISKKMLCILKMKNTIVICISVDDPPQSCFKDKCFHDLIFYII